MNAAPRDRTPVGVFVSVISVVATGGLQTAPVAGQWPQWGGKERNFVADAKDLAASWPEAGPEQLWSRNLGAGFSSIAAVEDRLYTMYRRGDDEVVVALDSQSGQTLWEHQYPAPLPEGMDPGFGRGPNATPLVHGEFVYAFGIGGQLRCLDRRTGKVRWSHDLQNEAGAKSPEFGFSSSPMTYRSSLIAAVGGPGCGIMAFDLSDGSILWKKHDFTNVYSSPIMINVDGKDEGVLLVDREVLGFDFASGEIEWRYPHENQWQTNITTPVWGGDQILYVSSGGDAGTRGLRIARKDGKFGVEEIWATRKVQISQGSVVRVGDYVYGSSGNESVFFVTAVHARTGQIVWRERGFGKSNLLYADGKIILLDEDGTLALATATPDALTVHSKVNLLKKSSWTVPTLMGQRLFVRDNGMIMALNVGRGAIGRM